MTDISISKSDPKGFTLLEVAISLFIIATTLLVVFRLQAQNLDLQSEANFITVARYLAQDRMSRLQGERSLSEGIDSGDFGEAHGNFTYQTEISKIPDREHLYRVKVSIFQQQNTFIKDFSVETHLYR
jgi:prepilin-type N-terminal cleavage/methylation domain-containing protein